MTPGMDQVGNLTGLGACSGTGQGSGGAAPSGVQRRALCGAFRFSDSKSEKNLTLLGTLLVSAI